jgi:hypothetical protein
MQTTATSRQPSSIKGFDPITISSLVFIALIALAIRLLPALSAQAPLNDGGLFYSMIRDLQHNGYRLPLFTSYNNAGIPFAYPPLGFYLTGFITGLSHAHLLDVARLLPSIISGLTIPVFFLLAKEVLISNSQAMLATLIFALTPRAFDWIIMGGGVTRSWGLLFALLAILFLYKLFTSHSPRYIFPAILFGGLVMVTHPEACLHTAVTALVIWLFKDRSKRGILYTLAVAVGVLLISAPWWGDVLIHHGSDPFIAALTSAGQDNVNPLVGLFVLFGFLFTDEPYMTLIACLGLLGLFALLARKRYFLPVWFLALHTVDPRSSPLYMMIPLAMFAGYGLDQLILPGLRKLNREEIHNDVVSPPEAAHWSEQILSSRINKIFVAFLFGYSVMSAFAVPMNVINHSTLKANDLNAMDWVEQNTPTDSRFLILTLENPLRDPTSEWFPALSDRTSLATVFGYEWVRDGRFGERLKRYKDLQGCAYEDAHCLENWGDENNLSYDYVYIRRPQQNGAEAQLPLIDFLQATPSYHLIYNSDQVYIFQYSSTN